MTRLESQHANGKANEPAADPEIVLEDVLATFEAAGVDRLSSAELVNRMAASYCETSLLAKNCELTERRLAWFLRPLDVLPRTMRVGNATPRGYFRADVEAAAVAVGLIDRASSRTDKHLKSGRARAAQPHKPHSKKEAVSRADTGDGSWAPRSVSKALRATEQMLAGTGEDQKGADTTLVVDRPANVTEAQRDAEKVQQAATASETVENEARTRMVAPDQSATTVSHVTHLKKGELQQASQGLARGGSASVTERKRAVPLARQPGGVGSPTHAREGVADPWSTKEHDGAFAASTTKRRDVADQPRTELVADVLAKVLSPSPSDALALRDLLEEIAKFRDGEACVRAWLEDGAPTFRWYTQGALRALAGIHERLSAPSVAATQQTEGGW